MNGRTWKDLFVYILENDMMNEDVFKDGKIPGFLSEIDLARKFNVGSFTIKAWNSAGLIRGFKVGGTLFFPEKLTSDPRIEKVKVPDDPDTAKQLSRALNISNNSVYGLTSANCTLDIDIDIDGDEKETSHIIIHY